MTSHSLPQLLSLRDIAAWQFPQLAQNMANQRPPIVAAIPSLQRGAVWKPQQVELLWDSILRGFPIWFDGNYSEFETYRKKQLGADAEPKRMKYKKIAK